MEMVVPLRFLGIGCEEHWITQIRFPTTSESEMIISGKNDKRCPKLDNIGRHQFEVRYENAPSSEKEVLVEETCIHCGMVKWELWRNPSYVETSKSGLSWEDWSERLDYLVQDLTGLDVETVCNLSSPGLGVWICSQWVEGQEPGNLAIELYRSMFEGKK